MSTHDSRPSTSASVHASSVVTRALHAPRIEVTLASDGLAFDSVRTATCPSCAARDATHVETFHLRRPSVMASLVERLVLPVTYAASLGAFFLGGHVLGMLGFFFGPALTTGLAALLKASSGKRGRCKVALCPACAAGLRHLAERTRMRRRVKNIATWMLVLMGPQLISGVGDRGLLLVTAGSLMAGSLVAWLAELRAARVEMEAHPALVEVARDRAVIALPGAWAEVLRRELPALQPRP